MNNLYTIPSIYLKFIRDFPNNFFILTMALALEAILVIVTIFSIIPIADYILDKDLKSPSPVTENLSYIFNYFDIDVSFYSLAALFVLVNIIKAISDIFLKYLVIKTKYDIIESLNISTVSLILEAKWAFFNKQSHGQIINSFTREIGQVGELLGHLTYILIFFFQLFIYLSVPIILDPILSITTLLLFTLFALPFLFIKKVSLRLGKATTETANKYISYLAETIGSIKLILSFAQQNKTIKSLKKKFNTHVKASVKSSVLVSSISVSFQPLCILAVMLSVSISIEQGTKITEVAPILWSFLKALPILGQLLQLNTTISNLTPSYIQINKLRSGAQEAKEKNGTKTFKKQISTFELKNINFLYSQKKYILKNLSIKFKSNEITAITGPSGSGKSTLINLVLGFEKPNSGEVLLNNLNLSMWDINSVRSNIGYVPQDPQLFNDTIRNNLLWSSPNATDTQLWEACEQANAKTFIKELKNGIDTNVGERGSHLSGGQKQRITLARALLKKPTIIILDEATSSLDLESELLIQDSINNLKSKCTIIIIAHRQATLQKSDIIYVLKNGKISEYGKFEDLKKRRNSYILNN